MHRRIPESSLQVQSTKVNLGKNRTSKYFKASNCIELQLQLETQVQREPQTVQMEAQPVQRQDWLTQPAPGPPWAEQTQQQTPPAPRSLILAQLRLPAAQKCA